MRVLPRSLARGVFLSLSLILSIALSCYVSDISRGAFGICLVCLTVAITTALLLRLLLFVTLLLLLCPRRSNCNRESQSNRQQLCAVTTTMTVELRRSRSRESRERDQQQLRHITLVRTHAQNTIFLLSRVQRSFSRSLFQYSRSRAETKAAERKILSALR